MYVGRAELGHLSGEGQARRDRRFLQSACPNKDDDDDDEEEEEEDEDNVDDDYNREDDDDKNHNHEDDDNDRQAKRFIAKKPASTNATAVPWD